jgi:hypothetical protein
MNLHTAKQNDGSYNTRFVIALSFAAYRANGGKYIKQTFSEEGKRVLCNKEQIFYTLAHMENDPNSVQKNWIPEKFVPLEVTEEDLENAELAIKFFKRYTLDAMTGEFSPFKRDVLNIISEETAPSHKLGIVGYIPELYNREDAEAQLRKRLKTEFAESEYLAGRVTGVVEILRTFYIQRFEKYAYTGGINGNLVSFMHDKKHKPGDKFHITAKFSAKDSCEFTKVPKSRINYVKLKPL